MSSNSSFKGIPSVSPPTSDSSTPAFRFGTTPIPKVHIPIATPGDLYITTLRTLSTGAQSEQCFEVNTALLSAVSPVFRTMLSPDSPFLERQAMAEAAAAGGKAYIRLGDDDAVAMEIVLRVVHMKYYGVPKSVEFALLLKIAVLADKYDLVEALQVWVERWTYGVAVGMMGRHGHENWLAICSIFKLPQHTDLMRCLVWRMGAQEDGSLIYLLTAGTGFGGFSPLNLIHPAVKDGTLHDLKTMRSIIITTLRTSIQAAWKAGTSCLQTPRCKVKCEEPFGPQNCDVLQMGDMFLQFEKHRFSDDAFWRDSPDKIITVIETLRKRQYPPNDLFTSLEVTPMDRKHTDCYWFKGVQETVKSIKLDVRVSVLPFGNPVATKGWGTFQKTSK